MVAAIPDNHFAPGVGSALQSKIGGVSLTVRQYNTGFILSYSQDNYLPFLHVNRSPALGQGGYLGYQLFSSISLIHGTKSGVDWK